MAGREVTVGVSWAWRGMCQMNLKGVTEIMKSASWSGSQCKLFDSSRKLVTQVLPNLQLPQLDIAYIYKSMFGVGIT